MMCCRLWCAEVWLLLIGRLGGGLEKFELPG